MNRHKLTTSFCVILSLSGLSIGCSEQGAANIPEEKVITKESSDEMVKQLEASRKAMGTPPK